MPRTGNAIGKLGPQMVQRILLVSLNRDFLDLQRFTILVVRFATTVESVLAAQCGLIDSQAILNNVFPIERSCPKIKGFFCI
jgi:hypothetical protein